MVISYIFPQISQLLPRIALLLRCCRSMCVIALLWHSAITAGMVVDFYQLLPLLLQRLQLIQPILWLEWEQASQKFHNLRIPLVLPVTVHYPTVCMPHCNSNQQQSSGQSCLTTTASLEQCNGTAIALAHLVSLLTTSATTTTAVAHHLVPLLTTSYSITNTTSADWPEW